MMKSLLCSIALFFCFGLFTNLNAQVPANDSCANAIDVMIDQVVAFSTVEATTDTLSAGHACGSGGATPDSLYQDLWYTFTSPITGKILWDLCGPTDFDTKIFVYLPGSDCSVDASDIYECNEDGPDLCGSVSQVIFDANAGESFLLRLGGYGDGSPGESGTGEFTLSEFIPTVPNDLCEDAIEIGQVTDYPFSTSEATTDGPDHPGNSTCFGFNSITADNDIWFTYTADFDGFVNWSLCNSVNFDSRLAVYGPNLSCPVADGDLYACNDDGANCDNFTSELIFAVESGNTYLLRLGAWNGNAGTGTFNLTEIIPPTPPANDQCMDADDSPFIISTDAADNLDVLVEGTTLNGTFDQDNYETPACITAAGGEFTDVWYTFNSLGNTEIEVRVNAVTPGAAFYVDILDGCGNIVDTSAIAGSCISVTTDAPFVVDTITGLPSEPTDYLLRVTTLVTFDAPGDFWFQLVGSIFTDVVEPQFESFSFFPNPVNENATTQFSLLESGQVNTRVYNTLGQMVRQENHGNLPQGKHSIQTSVAHLPAGIYFFNLQVNDHQESVRFVKK